MPGTDIRLAVEDVSKRFVLGGAALRGDLRERFSLRGLTRRRPAPVQPSDPGREFWALRDVTFTVRAGEAVGVVGHNGSGKSTLLKMLTGILPPTRGSVRTHGRIGALIEVGAGFHPDLTGRENVYLSGSILGLSRREIASRFDRIVAFAGVERFLDTPVKRYSSGMYTRLGFSIAAHLDPDILLVDEVLAVGDMQFQKKCLAHLRQFVSEGGCVVFVTHALNQFESFCDRALWLDRGALRLDGPTDEVVAEYTRVIGEREEEEFRRERPDEWAAREASRRAEQEARERAAQREREEAVALRALAEEQERLRQEERLADRTRGLLTGLRLVGAEGLSRTRFEAGEPISVEIDYRFGRPLPCPAFCVEFFRRADGLHMFTTSNFDHDLPLTGLPAQGTVRFEVPFLSLNEGEYYVRLRLYSDWKVGAWDTVLEDEIAEAGSLTVSAGRFAHGCAYLPVRGWHATAAAAMPKEEVPA